MRFVLAFLVLVSLSQAEPVTVDIKVDGHLKGTDPTISIIGDGAALTLEETGEVVSRAWMVLPPGTRGLQVSGSNTAQAFFTNRSPGTYVVMVAESGKDGSVAQNYHSIELRRDDGASPPVTRPVLMKGSPPKTPEEPNIAPPTPAREETLPQRVKRFTLKVPANVRAAELGQVQTALTQAAALITTGGSIIPQDGMIANLHKRVRDQVYLSLGSDANKLAHWEAWLAELKTLYEDLNKKGVLITPQDFSDASGSVAASMNGL